MNNETYIICVNAGSSSIRLAAFDSRDTTVPPITASVEHIDNYAVALTDCLTQLKTHIVGFGRESIVAIGYRVVHGGDQSETARVIDDKLLEAMEHYETLDPEHMPATLAIIKTMRKNISAATHVACFDTAFFHDIPRVAQLIALPRRFEKLGLRRYGFHGLSYAYLASMLASRYPESTSEKVVYAHLGSGASLAAVVNGEPVDMTMGFTPTSGIVMSSRSGDLDPSIVGFLSREVGVDVAEWSRIINKEAGLLGVSGDSSDMYALLQHEDSNPAVQEAIDLFVYQVQKAVGALSSAMGGVDRLVFSGGIGEKSAILRQRILSKLSYLNFSLDKAKNQAALDEELYIAADNSKPIHVIHTNENRIIADHVYQFVTSKH